MYNFKPSITVQYVKTGLQNISYISSPTESNSLDVLAEVTGFMIRSAVKQLRAKAVIVNPKMKIYLKHVEVVLTFWALGFAWSLAPIYSGSLFSFLSVPLPEKSIDTLFELNQAINTNPKLLIGRFDRRSDTFAQIS